MKIGFLVRKTEHSWGGDLAVVYSLMHGLRQLGHEASCSPTPYELRNADFLILTNSTVDQRMHTDALELLGKPYGILGFHEDILSYYTPATGFQNYILSCLGYGFASDSGIDYSIDMLIDMPHIVHYYGETPKRSSLYNYNLLAKASVCIANSPTEAGFMRRDCPECKTAVVPVAPGLVTGYRGIPDDSFLKLTGLSNNSYVLQIGRLECRKNQFGTMLAMRNLDIPLVFIAAHAFKYDYEVACVEAALRWRKAPTLFISQNLQPFEEGHVKVLPFQEKLPVETLLSAYYHAGLHLHPAFHELPGLTYLEAARLGTPTIGSSWCTIADYFHGELDGRIVYAPPHHIQEIENLIPKMFGKRFAPLEDHPAIVRNETDVASDLLAALPNGLL